MVRGREGRGEGGEGSSGHARLDDHWWGGEGVMVCYYGRRGRGGII